MQNDNGCDPDTRVVVDDTTIYEIDMVCYRCLSDKEKKLYHDDIFPVGSSQTF